MASAGPPKEDASDDGEYDTQFFEYPGLEIATSSILESFAANMNNSDDVGIHKHGRIVFLTNLERFELILDYIEVWVLHVCSFPLCTGNCINQATVTTK